MVRAQVIPGVRPRYGFSHARSLRRSGESWLVVPVRGAMDQRLTDNAVSLFLFAEFAGDGEVVVSRRCINHVVSQVG